ncbi:MAG: hypothetical protein KF914_11960 [Rhizobiaceae bacterium]|nr:hypothetical protein [Rhizobiaceae bacterium]
MTAVKNMASDQRQRRVFWQSLLEGLGGPMLMSAGPSEVLELRVSGVPRRPIVRRGLEDAFKVVGLGLRTQTDRLMKAERLVAVVESKKYLDSSGKLRDLRTEKVKRLHEQVARDTSK